MKTRQLIGWIIWTLVVVGVFAWIVTEVCGAPSPPPLPPMPKLAKTRKPITQTTQGAGAASLIAPRVVVPPPKTNYIVLSWTWKTNAMNMDRNDIVFVVRSLKTNQFVKPSLSWPVVVLTTNMAWTNVVDKSAQCVWHVVTASNKLTHYESDWARR